MRVLVTGAAGSIGRVVATGLAAQGHEVVAVDREQPPGTDGDTAVVADVLDAMVETGVRRMVYASSNLAVGRTPRTETVDEATRPPSGQLLRRRQGGRRGPGQPVRRPPPHRLRRLPDRFLPLTAGQRRHLSTWLSHADAVRMVGAALTTPHSGFAVLYGISANTRGRGDLAPGRALGYDPQDDAGGLLRRDPGDPESEDDRFEGSHVGEPFAADAFIRPAF